MLFECPDLFVAVDDGLPHRIEIVIKGKALNLTVDKSEPQSVVNTGPKETFELSTKSFLYIGGVSSEVASKATASFHLKQSHSFKGAWF